MRITGMPGGLAAALALALALALTLALTLAACAAAQEAPSPPPDQASEAAEDAGILIVGNKGEDTVSFIDLGTGSELSRAPTGDDPHEIAISPDGKTAAVVAYGGAQIDLYDIATRTRSETIDISPNRRPHGILWLSDDRIVATTEGSDTLTVLSAPDASGTRSVTGIPTGQKGSHMVAVSPDLARAYVANIASGSVTLVDLREGRAVRSVEAGRGTEGVAITPDGQTVLASSVQPAQVTVLSAELDTLATIPVGRAALRVITSPDGKWAVTSNYADGTLSVIDIARREVVRAIAVTDGSPSNVTLIFSPDGTQLYSAEPGRNTVAVIDFASGEVLGRLQTGSRGDGLGIAPKP